MDVTELARVFPPARSMMVKPDILLDPPDVNLDRFASQVPQLAGLPELLEQLHAADCLAQGLPNQSHRGYPSLTH
jgi:hypothetical protein